MLHIPFVLIGVVQGCHVDSHEKPDGRLGARCGPIMVMWMLQYVSIRSHSVVEKSKSWHGSLAAHWLSIAERTTRISGYWKDVDIDFDFSVVEALWRVHLECHECLVTSKKEQQIRLVGQGDRVSIRLLAFSNSARSMVAFNWSSSGRLCAHLSHLTPSGIRFNFTEVTPYPSTLTDGEEEMVKWSQVFISAGSQLTILHVTKNVDGGEKSERDSNVM